MLFRNNMSKTFSWDFACISPEKSFSKKERSIHLQEKNILLSSRLEKESVKQITFKQIVILWYRAEKPYQANSLEFGSFIIRLGLGENYNFGTSSTVSLLDLSCHFFDLNTLMNTDTSGR